MSRERPGLLCPLHFAWTSENFPPASVCVIFLSTCRDAGLQPSTGQFVPDELRVNFRLVGITAMTLTLMLGDILGGHLDRHWQPCLGPVWVSGTPTSEGQLACPVVICPQKDRNASASRVESAWKSQRNPDRPGPLEGVTDLILGFPLCR